MKHQASCSIVSECRVVDGFGVDLVKVKQKPMSSFSDSPSSHLFTSFAFLVSRYFSLHHLPFLDYKIPSNPYAEGQTCLKTLRETSTSQKDEMLHLPLRRVTRQTLGIIRQMPVKYGY